jgi:hypothetical protein
MEWPSQFVRARDAIYTESKQDNKSHGANSVIFISSQQTYRQLQLATPPA